MDVVMLSRIQFALTAGIHFIFVPLTIGLAFFIAIVETLYLRTNNPKYKTAAKFWGKLFAINFLLGVVTGVTMEFQFGTNWARYAEFMGDIFGSPLAFEALMAFFLESTFISIWIFGWDKVSKKMHLFAAWMVAFGTSISAVWIIIANGFMQNPVGYALEEGRVVMTDFLALMANPYAWHMWFHTIFAGWSVAAFFVLGVSAYHLLRRQHEELFRFSFKAALTLALISTLGNVISGHYNGQLVTKVQPTKFAAMEALWETQEGAPMHLLAIPDAENERNTMELFSIPKLTSWLATHDANAEIKGLKEFPVDERPPVGMTFWSFRIMVGLGFYMLFMILLGWYLQAKGKLQERTGFLKLLMYSIPVPYIATLLGWMVAEVGRQPWTVYGLMRTADSVSPIPASSVLISLVVVGVIYTLLVVLDIYFLVVNAKKGPEAVEGHEAAAPSGAFGD